MGMAAVEPKPGPRAADSRSESRTAWAKSASVSSIRTAGDPLLVELGGNLLVPLADGVVDALPDHRR